MSIQTGIGAPMTDVIIALCVLFVIGVGVSERRRLENVHDVDKTETTDASDIKGGEENVV
jgi:hypothetical protein